MNTDNMLVDAAVYRTTTSWTNTIMVEGLNSNTTYGFSVSAMNNNSIVTVYGTEAYYATLADAPTAPLHSANTTDSITWEWSTGGRQKEYYAYDVDESTDSGWIAGTSWVETTLSANTSYVMYVKARNWNNAETVSVSTRAYTTIETPSGVDFGTVTNNSIQARSDNTPSNLAWDVSGLIIENETEMTDSTWQQDNNYWTSVSLEPNTTYSFRIKARNGENEETAYINCNKSIFELIRRHKKVSNPFKALRKRYQPAG